MTTLKCVSRVLVVAAVLCGLAGSQPTAAPRRSDPRVAIREALRVGKKVVVVVVSDKDAESEAYSDWYGYFSDFSKKVERNNEIKVISMTRASYARVVEEPKMKESFGVLFLPDATHGLLYDGMILEPGVYAAGLGYLAKKPDDKAIGQWGLVRATVRLR